ncbi:hypothetical protein G6011_10566 [Alternaria panax]|uniref:Uncharacterized protein n=1 Tax=Alternaria panax TaxID=48097 RepID=A0AAD4IBW0_9PLEO|nr:hypothetical protein G6011_10566 [Alternaria panax]
MAPSQTHPDWDSLNSNGYQTIDLTLSSPEPEPEPRRRPQPRSQPRPPQRQAQLYFGREPRPYGIPNVKMEASQPMASARNPVAPQPARPINPEHIKQIIDTADPRALQKLLLQLCQVSPAFSGALVRGLAPQSTIAQAMISKHRMRSQQPEHDEESDEIYEATKMKLARSVHSTPNHTPTEEITLSGERLGVKDIYDLKGVRTSGGNRVYRDLVDPAPESGAALQKLSDMGSVVIGKTKTTQFALGERPTSDYGKFSLYEST